MTWTKMTHLCTLRVKHRALLHRKYLQFASRVTRRIYRVVSRPIEYRLILPKLRESETPVTFTRICLDVFCLLVVKRRGASERARRARHARLERRGKFIWRKVIMPIAEIFHLVLGNRSCRFLAGSGYSRAPGIYRNRWSRAHRLDRRVINACIVCGSQNGEIIK